LANRIWTERMETVWLSTSSMSINAGLFLMLPNHTAGKKIGGK